LTVVPSTLIVPPTGFVLESNASKAIFHEIVGTLFTSVQPADEFVVLMWFALAIGAATRRAINAPTAASGTLSLCFLCM
jgi:hypothetical protein